ncbi:helix-hairpin-helix domain-containing protein [Lentibacillus halophilus]|uniref:Helix-hairpin-helix domain-containing protein n=1 Tax=Lentibacillus halophilus TaxID=295065 RepID=A0ABN0ZC07_9BACI
MFHPLKKYLFPIILVLAVAVFLFWNMDKTGDVDVEKHTDATENDTDMTVDGKKDDQPTAIIVDIKGEVVDPGVYDVKPDSRVHDVIQMAGGFTKQADRTTVNLAQKVQDEMVIMVSSKANNNQVSPSSPESASDKVRINNADQATMETLNGIGPSKAQAIIQYRDDNGLFKKADDLLDVSGIGEKTLEALKDDIQVP